MVDLHYGGKSSMFLKCIPILIVTMAMVALEVSPTLASQYSSRNGLKHSEGKKYIRKHSRHLLDCSQMIENGDFHGSLHGWTSRGSGTISVFQGTSLLISDRTDWHDGPQISLPPECLIKGSTFRVFASMKLALNAATEYKPYDCNPLLQEKSAWKDPHSCPIVTFELIYPDGHQHWVYGISSLSDDWVEDNWNDFYAEIHITEKVANATIINMYFERVEEGVDILLDNVKVEEMGGDLKELGTPIESFSEYSNLNCTQMILNEDFEDADHRGWSTRLGGKLLKYPHGYQDSGDALLYTNRKSAFEGPRHDILTECVTEGKRYRLESQIKLLDEDGNGFTCDKSKPWESDLACPLLTVQYNTMEGEKKWAYFENEAPTAWEGDSFNWFVVQLYISEEMKTAVDIFFFFERVKPGVSIIFDNSQMERQCDELIPNGDAMGGTGTLEGWIPSHGNGQITIQNSTIETEKNSTQQSYFIHQGRGDIDEGPRQNIDPLCLVEGSKYEVEFQVKLATDGVDYVCDKDTIMGDPEFCPLVTLAVTNHDDNIEKVNVVNMIGDKWEKGFNKYKGTFTVDEKMANAKAIYFYIRGPDPAIDILFDQLVVRPYHPKLKTCDELIYNGDAEHGIEEWSTDNGGYVQTHIIGYDSANGAISQSGRLSTSSSLRHVLNPECLIEGIHFVFVAQFKLVDEYNNPYACERDSSDDPCVLASIYIEMPQGIQPIHLPNKSPRAWNATGWNFYRSDFVINVDLASAALTELKVRGPKAGVTVIMDNASLKKYEPPGIHCSEQMIRNGDAEDLDYTAWIPAAGKIDLWYTGAFGTETALMFVDRQLASSGPKQSLDTSCFVEGKKLQLTTYFKLIDDDGVPFQCDPNALWGSPEFCIVIAFDYKIGENSHALNYQSDVSIGWVADEWNFFHKIITIDSDMSIADEVMIHVKGPKPGISILMDEVRLREYIEPAPSCHQLVTNSNAENEDLMFWKANNGGEYTFTSIGLDNTMAFKYHKRRNFASGIRQDFHLECFGEIGTIFEVNGLFQLRNSEDLPYACDKSKGWKDPLYCVLMTIEMRTESGQLKRRHYANNDGGAWVADEWNRFFTTFTVTVELARSKSAFFYFQGPPAESSIVFDQITMTPQKVTS